MLRIDKGSLCVFRCTYIIFIILMAFVQYDNEMFVYELSDDINHMKMH